MTSAVTFIILGLLLGIGISAVSNFLSNCHMPPVLDEETAGREPSEPYSIALLRDKLARVEDGEYYVKSLLNDEERNVYEILKAAIDIRYPSPGFRILPQVPLGSYLQTNRREWEGRKDWAALASSRPDIVITTYYFRPIVVVEYDGRGHARRGETKTALADKIKEVALAKVGIDLIRVCPEDSSDTYVERVTAAIEAYRKRQ